MKKKLLTILMVIFSVSMCMFTLTACGHKHEYASEVINPTCTEKGYTKHTCECGDTYNDTYVDELDHAYTSSYTWENDICTAVAICGNDSSHTVTESVTATYIKDTDATCTTYESGHYQATFTNAIFATQETAKDSVVSSEAPSHDYSISYTWENDVCTATRVCAKDSSHFDTEIVTAVYIKDTDATCTTPESGHYQAVFTNSIFETQETAKDSVVSSEIPSHDYSISYSWNDNVCTAVAICSKDSSHTITENITATYVKDTDKTATTEETGHYEATFANSIFEAQATAKDSVIHYYPTEASGMEVVPVRNPADTVGFNTYNSNLSYVAEFEGATGVIKAEMSGWGGFEFKPQQDASAFEDASYIVIRMYVDAPSTPGVFWINNAATAKTTTVVGAWAEYKFAIGDVNLSAFNCVTGDPGTAWTIYIDEIYAAGATKATGNEVIPVRCEYDTVGFTSYGSTITYVDEFNGATGVIKVDVESWGGFEFKAQQDASVFADYTYVVIKYWANVAHTSIWMNNATQAPFVFKNFDNVNTWAYFVMKTSELDLSSKILLTYNTTNGSIYIDEIFATNSLEFANGGLVEDFAESTSTTSFVGATSTEYLASYEGKEGVVKVNVETSDNMNTFTFKSTNVTKEEIVFGDWDYFEVTFYASIGKWLYSNNAQLDVKNTANGWYTMKVQKSKISNLSSFATNLTGSGIQLVMVYADSTPLTEVYFDSVKFVKNA